MYSFPNNRTLVEDFPRHITSEKQHNKVYVYSFPNNRTLFEDFPRHITRIKPVNVVEGSCWVLETTQHSLCVQFPKQPHPIRRLSKIFITSEVYKRCSTTLRETKSVNERQTTVYVYSFPNNRTLVADFPGFLLRVRYINTARGQYEGSNQLTLPKTYIMIEVYKSARGQYEGSNQFTLCVQFPKQPHPSRRLPKTYIMIEVYKSARGQYEGSNQFTNDRPHFCVQFPKQTHSSHRLPKTYITSEERQTTVYMYSFPNNRTLVEDFPRHITRIKSVNVVEVLCFVLGTTDHSLCVQFPKQPHTSRRLPQTYYDGRVMLGSRNNTTKFMCTVSQTTAPYSKTSQDILRVRYINTARGQYEGSNQLTLCVQFPKQPHPIRRLSKIFITSEVYKRCSTTLRETKSVNERQTTVYVYSFPNNRTLVADFPGFLLRVRYINTARGQYEGSNQLTLCVQFPKQPQPGRRLPKTYIMIEVYKSARGQYEGSNQFTLCVQFPKQPHPSRRLPKTYIMIEVYKSARGQYEGSNQFTLCVQFPKQPHPSRRLPKTYIMIEVYKSARGQYEGSNQFTLCVQFPKQPHPSRRLPKTYIMIEVYKSARGQYEGSNQFTLCVQFPKQPHPSRRLPKTYITNDSMRDKSVNVAEVSCFVLGTTDHISVYSFPNNRTLVTDFQRLILRVRYINTARGQYERQINHISVYSFPNNHTLVTDFQRLILRGHAVFYKPATVYVYSFPNNHTLVTDFQRLILRGHAVFYKPATVYVYSFPNNRTLVTDFQRLILRVRYINTARGQYERRNQLTLWKGHAVFYKPATVYVYSFPNNRTLVTDFQRLILRVRYINTPRGQYERRNQLTLWKGHAVFYKLATVYVYSFSNNRTLVADFPRLILRVWYINTARGEYEGPNQERQTTFLCTVSQTNHPNTKQKTNVGVASKRHIVYSFPNKRTLVTDFQRLILRVRYINTARGQYERRNQLTLWKGHAVFYKPATVYVYSFPNNRTLVTDFQRLILRVRYINTARGQYERRNQLTLWKGHAVFYKPATVYVYSFPNNRTLVTDFQRLILRVRYINTARGQYERSNQLT
ncbi:hypothetical protein J6590_073632 [Homalodisca vitripennis]|nr:hypothetical protein J6590_073632 [Homalodisca vitripennis]